MADRPLICSTVGHRHVVDTVFFDEQEHKLFATWTCAICGDVGVTEKARLRQAQDRRNLLVAILFLAAVFGFVGVFAL